MKVKQTIQEATSYNKQTRDIRKQAATDMPAVIISNKYNQSALMKEFIKYLVDIVEEDLLCRESGDMGIGNKKDKKI